MGRSESPIWLRRASGGGTDRQTDGQPYEKCGLEQLANTAHAIESVYLIKQVMFKGQYPIQWNLYKGHSEWGDTSLMRILSAVPTT